MKIPVAADEDWIIAVKRMPNSTSKSGRCMISYWNTRDNCMLSVESAPPMAISMTSIPMKSMPKPMRKGAILFNFSLSVVKMMRTPMNERAANTELMLNPPLLSPEMAKRKAVKVVPTFAPKMNPAPCFTVTIFACASPTVMMEVADEDWTRTVEPIPIP